MSSRYRSTGVSSQPSSSSLMKQISDKHLQFLLFVFCTWLASQVEQALKQVFSAACALLFGVRRLGYSLGRGCPPPWHGRLCSSLLLGFMPPWPWPSARQHLVSYFVLFFSFVTNDFLKMCCNNWSLP